MWGHTRQYSNRLKIEDVGNGFGWRVKEWAYLEESSGGGITVYLGAYHIVVFNETAQGFETTDGSKYRLVHDEDNSIYRLIKPTGEICEFQDFSEASLQPGMFKSKKTLASLLTEVTEYTNSDRIETVKRYSDFSASQSLETFEYAYYSTGLNTGRLESVTSSRYIGGNWVAYRQAVYEYYEDSDANGSTGDLQRVTVQVPGSSPEVLQRFYYRYYKDSSGDGFKHGLKYVVQPEAYERLLAAVGNPLTASDAQVAQYADYYYEYDANRCVTHETVDAGTASYDFSFENNSNPSYTDAFNHWFTKTTEDLPDGSQRIVYTNYVGQVLLSDFRSDDTSGADRWITYWQYYTGQSNTTWNGLLQFEASPAAIDMDHAGGPYDDSANDLDVHLRTDLGRIEHREYYPDSDSNAPGWVKTVSLQRGSSGSLVKQNQFEYDLLPSLNDESNTGLSKSTVFRTEAGAAGDEISTEFTYSLDLGALLVLKTTTLPKIPESQNGPPSATPAPTITEAFDERMALRWRRDERDVITYFAYDPVTGAMTRRIDDVDTSQTSEFSQKPTGWLTKTGFGLNLITDYENDALGRITQELGPAHSIDAGADIRTATWTVYDDANHEVRAARGYLRGTSNTLVNPVQIRRFDEAGDTTEVIQATKGSTVEVAGKLESTDTFAQSSYVRWTVNVYNDKEELETSRVYYDIPSSGTGNSTSNYNETSYIYDIMGRRTGVRTPGGTITRMLYDTRGLETDTYVGTNDNNFAAENFDSSGTSNLVLTTSNQYDGGADGGNSLLTRVTKPVNANSTNDRVTEYRYDWRDRLEKTIGEENLFLRNFYDNLNRVIKREANDGSGVGEAGGALINRDEALYDDRDRVYRQIRYAVNPSTGSVGGNPLQSNSWFDAAGNVIKEAPAGAEIWTKSLYNGLHRLTSSFVGYGTTSPFDGDPVANDIIFQQIENTYADGVDLTYMVNKRRYDNAPTSGTGSTGQLTDPSGSDPKARNLHTAYWFDGIGRRTDVADYGTASTSRPATPPTSSGTIHVTSTTFNVRGEPFQTTDSEDRIRERTWDDANRLIKDVANIVTSSTTWDEDRTVEYEYNSNGRVTKFKAVNADTGNQETIYTYGVTTSASALPSNELLHTVKYPASAAEEEVTVEYNRQGQIIKLTDQNDTVHDFSFDGRGRPTSDSVSATGSGVDDAVLRIGREYEVRGMLATVTSYDAASGGNVLNQVHMVYNDFSQLTESKQDHSTTVSVSTPKVQYAYADGSNNTIRRTSMTYPDMTVLEHDYGTTGSADDELSRVAAFKVIGESDNLIEYTYLGAGSIVKADYVQPEIRYDLATGSGASRYAGLDSFDRTSTCLWNDYGSSTDIVKLNYTYDRVNNRTSRDDVVSKAQSTAVYLDQVYQHDGLDRLVDLEQGQLSSGSITNPNFRQNWEKPSTTPAETALDPTGNWANFRQDDNGGGGTWELDQTRDHNEVNEITSITGGSWAAPAYDAAGNETTIPWPPSMGVGLTATYDAWNRLVKTTGVFTTTHEYDGLNRRMVKTAGAETRHYYYSESWQVVEERTGTATTADSQHFWGLRYVDDLIRRDKGTETLYGLQDDNWNMVAITNSSGAVQQRYSYDAYGNAALRKADFSIDSGSLLLDILYSGYRLDIDTLLYQVRNRFYHTKLGRWVTRDPLSQSGDTNLYVYVANRPISATDPEGLKIYPVYYWVHCENLSYPGLDSSTPGTDLYPGIMDDMKKHGSAGFKPSGILQGYGAGYTDWLNLIYLPKDYFNEKRQFSCPMTCIQKGEIANEVFHAWWDQILTERDECRWLYDRILREGRRTWTGNPAFPPNEEHWKHMTEEAMSEAADFWVHLQCSNVPPLYSNASSPPSHNDVGGTFEGNPYANVNMSRELYSLLDHILRYGCDRTLPNARDIDERVL